MKSLGSRHKFVFRFRNIVVLFFVLVLPAQLISTIRGAQKSRTTSHVEMLASDRFEGRLTGTPGAQRAASYIVRELEKLGAQSLPGHSTFKLPFEFAASVSDGGSSLSIIGDEVRRWKDNQSVHALPFSDDASVTSSVVFAGYGLLVPETDGISYDSFGTLDVTGKIVMVLDRFPEEVNQDLRVAMSRHSALRRKVFTARERGAKGFLVVTDEHSPQGDQHVSRISDPVLSDSGIAAARISSDVAEMIFRNVPDMTLSKARKSLKTASLQGTGFNIPGLEMTLDVKVDRETKTAFNVVGYLPPLDTSGNIPVKPYLILGAHYDHLGRGEHGKTLAETDDRTDIHYGADDNASGVAVVLSAGAELIRIPRQRGVVLAFWSGEELGLLGSADFVKMQAVRMDQVVAYLNFDMVGRMRDTKLTVQGVGTSTIWTKLIKDTNMSFTFDLSLIRDPYLPTDILSFNRMNVPSVGFFTGSHDDYHRPSDIASTINYHDLDRIAEFAVLVSERLANLNEPPEFIEVERHLRFVERTNLRISTGTIPDYTSATEGLLLAGVIDGGPADEAGLREGDVIIELANQRITNIYDYTYVLNALKAGVLVQVVFLRDSERLETTLRPEARR